jgi:alpha-beta hydrolase superfamily lysophospholipase
VSRMLGQLEKRIASLPPGDVVLIGSSLGGFVTVEAGARQVNQARHPISHLVLLAPAVELEWEHWSEVGSGGIERWHQTGSVDVFHHAQNKMQRLNFEFYRDSEKYRPASRRMNLPLLIFQGRHDDSVSPAIVEAFAHAQADSTLHLLEDGHQLKNSLAFIWLETARFLSLD